LLQQADKHLQARNYHAAQTACEQALRKAPRHPDALMLAGVVQLALGQPERAIPLLEQTLRADPRHGAALEHLGLACLMLGRFAEAEQTLSKASTLSGAPASVHMRLGIAILEQGRPQEALPLLSRAAAAHGADADAWLNLGRTHAILGEPAAAQAAFESALRMAPHRPEPAHNLGLMALEARDLPQAQRWFEQALACAPEFVDARLQLAIVAQRQSQYERAVAYLRQVLELDVRNDAAEAALASVLFQIGRLDEARAAVERCLARNPANVAAIGTLANVLLARAALAPAIEILEAGWARTGDGGLLGMLVYLLRQACDWERWHAAWSDLQRLLASNSDVGSPFWLLCEPLGNEALLDYTRGWADTRFGPTLPRPTVLAGAGTTRRLRIGYLSSDLHEHATAYLIADVIERHDRERFEVFAYSYGPEDGSPMRARLRAAFEHFVDIAQMPDEAAANRIHADGLDLLIDLKGYTLGDRLAIMARRPCAVQATWLGYPGTTAAAFIDYVIADPVVIPESHEPWYTERVARMPMCYQPNDRARVVAEPKRRSTYGLPDDNWVFCCFNQTYKITQEVFAVWMRLLQQVPGSVLWLLESNDLAAKHLARAAQSLGIEPARIVFAPRLPNAEHLARYRVADLALDTFPYTSHTTMSDALWCGCPAIGLCGETFAARVSASLLHAAGLPELVTRTLEEYERLAVKIATDLDYSRGVRSRVVKSRNESALFDSPRFAQDLEALFEQMLAEHTPNG